MKLISIVNSGESLEKVATLIIMAYKSNSSFYNSYDEVIVFYSSNVIKSKNDLKVSGLVSSLINNKILKIILDCSQINDLYIYRQKILNVLYKNGKISKRQEKKLYKDKTLFIKLITNISWTEIFPNFEHLIINKIEKEFKNLKIININNLYSIEDIIKSIPHYQNFGKLYFYDYNGSTISKSVNKSADVTNLSKLVSNSIYYTFNVYIFIMLIYNYAVQNDAYIGYRPMKTSSRKSYDEAIKFVVKSYDKTIIEPQNTLFNESLSRHSFKFSINERSSLAIYDNFCDFILNNNFKIL